MNKQTFKIVERKPAYLTWTYEVEAVDGNQALMGVLAGAFSPTDYSIETDEDEEVKFDVEEIIE